jgi:hypothetical protein
MDRIPVLRKQIAEQVIDPLPSFMDAHRHLDMDSTAHVPPCVWSIGRIVVFRNIGQFA